MAVKAKFTDTNTARVAEELYLDISGRGMTYYITTYGCQMNAHDSEKLAGILESCGYKKGSSVEESDFILFNTCCVREHAEKRVFSNIGALKKLKDEKPSILLGVCGCMMQQKEVADTLSTRYPFVDIIFGTNSMARLPLIIANALHGERVLDYNKSEGGIHEGLPVLREGGISASVNIMYGCDNYCSYCIVPYVRGHERSRNPDDIISEISALSKNGYSEIMLLGQNVNSYALENGQLYFPELLRMVNDIDGIKRIRFMTSHPKDLSDELISAMADCPNVARHIHLPVQSGSNEILLAMNRKYTREHYLTRVEKLRLALPSIEITTDFIVGFPGETEENFEDTLSIARDVEYSAAFTFMYSARSGTSAALMEDQVPADVKKDRLLRLNDVQAQNTKKTNERYVGRCEEILVEGKDERKENLYFGKLSSAKSVYFHSDTNNIGQYVWVDIDGTNQNTLTGVIKK